MSAYRDAPRPPTVIRTRLAALDASMRAALRVPVGAPDRVALGAPVRAWRIGVGLLLLMLTFPTWAISSLGRSSMSDGGSMLFFALASVGATLAVLGLASVIGRKRWPTPQALVAPPWLVCSDHGEAELWPLVLVERVTVVENELVVSGGDAGSARHRIDPTPQHYAFAVWVERAVATASAPGDPSAWPREIPRRGRASSVALFATGPVLGLTLWVGVLTASAQAWCASTEDSIRFSLDSARTDPGSTSDADPMAGVRDELDLLAGARASGGLSGWLFANAPQCASIEARYRPIYVAAETTAGAARDARQDTTTATSTDLVQLRWIVDHGSTVASTNALTRIGDIRDAARAAFIASGPSATQLALCDGARTGSVLLSMNVTAAGGFNQPDWASDAQAVQAGLDRIASAASAGLDTRMYAAFGIHLAGMDRDARSVVNVTMRPGATVLVLSRETASWHQYAGGWRAPDLAADVRVTITAPTGGTVEDAFPVASSVDATGEQLAALYPTVSVLYTSEGEQIADAIVARVAQLLCIP